MTPAAPNVGWRKGQALDLPQRHVASAALDLAASIAAAANVGADASSGELRLVSRLKELAERLHTERFQLAVVGQFKRGKSSLLNALLGIEALPTGVTPLTAIPTYISGGIVPALQVEFKDGSSRNWTFDNAGELRGRLTEFVTEPGNPENAKAVSRTEATLPSSLLNDGLVLIDTPGVGSTYRHNTEAAEAALPECDAALVVLSPDPPITEVELDYLEKVRQSTAALVVVLNKVDVLDEVDRVAAMQFLRAVLDRADVGEVEIVPLSARRAAEAKVSGDGAMLTASGLAALEAKLHALVSNNKHTLLVAAATRKSAALISELQFENDVALAALTAPMEVLDQRLAALEVMAKDFAAEQRAASDLLAGDRRRLLDQLEIDASDLMREAQAQLVAELDQRIAEGTAPDRAWAAMSHGLNQLFDRALGRLSERARDRLTRALRDHQQRAEELLDEVRRAAAELLDVPCRAPAADAAFEARSEPYWVVRPPETLNPIPPDLVERLLPSALRRRRARQRILGAIATIVGINVEHLRWATRQNIEEAFRQYERRLQTALKEGIGAVREAAEAARRLRTTRSDFAAESVRRREDRRRTLAELQSQLARPPIVGADSLA